LIEIETEMECVFQVSLSRLAFQGKFSESKSSCCGEFSSF